MSVLKEPIPSEIDERFHTLYTNFKIQHNTEYWYIMDLKDYFLFYKSFIAMTEIIYNRRMYIGSFINNKTQISIEKNTLLNFFDWYLDYAENKVTKQEQDVYKTLFKIHKQHSENKMSDDQLKKTKNILKKTYCQKIPK